VLLAVWVPAGIVSLFFGTFHGTRYVQQLPVVVQWKAYAALENPLPYYDAYERIETALAYPSPLIAYGDLLTAIEQAGPLDAYTPSEAQDLLWHRALLVGYLPYYPDEPVLAPLLEWVDQRGAARLVNPWYAAGHPAGNLDFHRTVRTRQVRQIAAHALLWLHHPRGTEAALHDYVDALTTIRMNPGIYRACSPGSMSGYERLPINQRSRASLTMATHFYARDHGTWPQNMDANAWWEENRRTILNYYDDLIAAAQLDDAP